MFDSLIFKAGTALLRHFLTGVGATLVTSGYITDGQSTEIIGAIMTLIGVAWSAWSARKEHKAAVVAKRDSDLIDTAVAQAAEFNSRVEVRPLPPAQ